MADGYASQRQTACLRCKVRRDAAPAEAQIRILANEDWIAEAGEFSPRAMTQEQAVASELLTSALGRFVTAYGVDIAGARLGALVSILRAQAKRQKITERVLRARSEINRRARLALELGDGDGALEIQNEPTPEYPGKARDDAWLRSEERGGAQ
jgi:hypothetical protein